MHEIFNSPSCEVRLQDIACSRWLLKMRKLEKLTRFCQICFAARGAGGVEEIGNCEERKTQGPGGSKSLLAHSLEARKATKMTLSARIGSTSELTISEGKCSSSSLFLRLQQWFKATVGTKALLCWAKESVSLQVKDAGWGWKICGGQNGGDGGSTLALWKFSHRGVCPQGQIYDRTTRHRALTWWKVKLGLLSVGCWGTEGHGSPLNLPRADILLRGDHSSACICSEITSSFFHNHLMGITSGNWFRRANVMSPYGEETTLVLTVKCLSAACNPSQNNLWM